MTRFISILLLFILIHLFLPVQKSYAQTAVNNGKAIIKWRRQAAAAGYNIYYRELKESVFTHAVANVPAEATSLTINFLKPGITYAYVIRTVDASGAEYSQTRVLRVNSTR